MKILAVEDDAKTAAYLHKGLSESGYVVDVAADGLDGYHLATSCAYHLIILDLLLPRLDGWTVLARTRETGVQTPVLFLSARDSINEIAYWAPPAPNKLVDTHTGVALAPQSCDIYVRPDGLMYVSDWNAGLHVLQYEG